MSRASVLIPAVLEFAPDSARAESWARLLELGPGGAILSTPARLRRGETALVTFELGGETLSELRGKVVHVEDDADGRPTAELRWLDPVQRRRLARALLSVLSA